MDSDAVFKRCPSCFAEWRTRDDFLSDVSIELHGFKTDFKKLEYGLLFFTHQLGDCLSTMVLAAKDFLDIYQGPRYLGSKVLNDDCPQYCLDEKQLSRCDALCACAFVREVTHLISERQKVRNQA